ncbi:hypothetical protein [Palaeococcus sp. (in: euryarchaeotes)]
MTKRVIFAILLVSLFVSGILLIYTPSRYEIPKEQPIQWTQNCSKFVEYPVPDNLPHKGWRRTGWGEVHPEKNITKVLILRIDGRWRFNLTACAYDDRTLFLKFNAKNILRSTSTFETTTAPLLYESYLWIIPKIKADRIVAYIRGDMDKKIIIQLETSRTSNNTPIQGCMHPGYGEFNIDSIKLSKKEIIIHEGERVEVRGSITGKEYHVGEAGGSKNTCYYDGCVVLRAYLGPEASKSSWSYMSGKLTEIEGLNVKITPQKFCLKSNETIEFQVEVIAQKAGTYYLYIVAFGEKGWKSWDVIEIKVR